MSDETFVQLFWSLAILVFTGLGLIVLGVLHAILEDPVIRYIRRMEKARRKWAKILERDRHAT